MARAFVPPHSDGTLPHYVTREEAHQMLDAATTERDHMLIAVLWNTGGRISEVIRLRKADFYGDHLRLANLKQHHQPQAQKIVYLSPEFAEELLQYLSRLEAGDYLFPSPKLLGKPIGRQYAWRIIKGIARRSGILRLAVDQIRYAWPHLFRHGNAVHQLRSGVPVKIVKDQLGHSSILTTELYSRFSAEDKKHFIGQVAF